MIEPCQHLADQARFGATSRRTGEVRHPAQPRRTSPADESGRRARQASVGNVHASLDPASEVLSADKRLNLGKRFKPEQISVDRAGVDVSIVAIDRALSSQVDAILHHPN
jgi:hypothetical protein